MRKLLVFLFFVLPILCFSQCPPNMTFNSQTEIDAFATDYPDCTIAYGGLIIEGDDITDLSGLNQITSTSGLTINNNPLLQTLNGINENLVVYNPAICELNIRNNASLIDVSGLQGVGVFGDMRAHCTISDNPLLSSLNGIPCVTDTFSITNNNSLTNLEGMENCSSEIIIDDNDNLIDLSGIENYDGEYISINNNMSLESLNMGNTLVQYLTISNNSNLIDISGPTAPEIWGFNSIVLENNTSLSICNVDYLCSHLTGDAYFSIIRNNAPGCENRVAVELACGVPPFNDDCSNSGPNFLIDIGETISFNNELATTSTAIPSCNDTVDRQDVWFLFNSEELTSVDIIAEPGFNIQLWEAGCPSTLHVVDACGSTALTDIPVTTDTNYWVQIWSDDGGRMMSGWFDLLVQDGLLSTPEFEVDEINIFPNPVQNELFIQSIEPIDTIQVYNLLGQQVLESQATTLDFSHLTEGIYLVKISSRGLESTYKIVKE